MAFDRLSLVRCSASNWQSGRLQQRDAWNCSEIIHNELSYHGRTCAYLTSGMCAANCELPCLYLRKGPRVLLTQTSDPDQNGSSSLCRIDGKAHNHCCTSDNSTKTSFSKFYLFGRSVSAGTPLDMWRLAENLKESILTFCHVKSKTQTSVIKLGG